MIINGFTKLTLLDFPGKVACIVFTGGCNYSCPFCHNSGLIKINKDEMIDSNVIFEYLENRKNIIDGVVISGGEPTIQKNLKNFIKKIKKMGYLVKLDTNGSNPEVLKELIDEKLIDYIAMDIKNIFDDYEIITNVLNINIDNIKKSIELIKKSNIAHEFRTTIMKNYHTTDKILKICEYLGKDEKYFLQNFVDSSSVLQKNLIPFTRDELKNIKELMKLFPNVIIRGL